MHVCMYTLILYCAYGNQKTTCGETFLFFHQVSLRDRTQVIRLGSKHLLSLSHFSSFI